MSDRGPLQVLSTRGACIETSSEVLAVVVDRVGDVIETFGDVRPSFPVRSTVKSLQAIPLVESGAADSLAISEAELALACASHGGEDGHASAVEDWLRRLRLGVDDLRCPAALPMIDEISEEYLTAGGHRSRLRHNCSGKHAGFLALARYLGSDPRDYLQPTGTVQREVLEVVSERCGIKLNDKNLAIDGCGAPVACMPLPALSRGLATLLGTAPATPEARLRHAMAHHPWLVGGTHRFDTTVIERTRGRVIPKIGADGLHVAFVGNDAAVAVKSLSGTRVPAQVALVEVLRRLAVWTEDEFASLPRPAIRNDMGEIVGEFRLVA